LPNNYTYKYSTSQDSEYIIEFSVFETELDIGDILVYDLVLKLLNNKGS